MKSWLAAKLWSNALRTALPIYYARLWWRGRHEPGYREAWRERLGFAPAADPASASSAATEGPASAAGLVVWIHAVSLGETRAAEPLIAALRSQLPRLRLLLTASTATGREAGRRLLRDGDAQAWLPVDTPGSVDRFLRRERPDLGVLMETEIWPNLLAGAKRRGIPVVLANARLSEKSARKGRRFDALLRPAVEALDLVLAQTEADAQRLRAAGARRVEVLGNLKFDMAPDPSLIARGQAWRHALGRAVVLAASTREGEEEGLLEAWRAAPEPRPLLLLVPRHPQRFDEVAGLLERQGWRFVRRSAVADSALASGTAVAEVWLGDSIGEMPAYYAVADAALLGGSFAPLGGQNLIEAAACGCPVVMGPHTFNFAQAAEMAAAAGAALRVADWRRGVETATAIARDAGADRRRTALAFAQAHRGSAAASALRLIEVARRAG